MECRPLAAAVKVAHLLVACGVITVDILPSIAHELLFLQKGLRPHNYCLPILKRERHREAVAAAATSGSKKFFLGTDSAPHAVHTKEAACGCAGIFSAPIALALYATAFEQVSMPCPLCYNHKLLQTI